MYGSKGAFVLALVILDAFWVIGAITALATQMLPPLQMRRYRSVTGIPFLGHFGMLNDMLTIHPLLAFDFALYWAAWFVHPWRTQMFVVAILVALG